MNQPGYSFDDKIVVQKVHSQLEGGCIFTGLQSNGNTIRIKYTGRYEQPLPGDSFHVLGQIGEYKSKFGARVVQIDSKSMRRTITPGELLTPWLESFPNLGPDRAKRLIEAYGHDLLTPIES